MENKIGVKPEQLEKLKEPIEFKWRVQSHFTRDKQNFLRMAAYVDARDVQDKLDEVLSPENWQDIHYELKGRIYCKLGININGVWVYKSDVGSGGSGMEKEKTESSDSFKRAAVKWGVNRGAYRIGIVELPGRQHGKTWFPTYVNGEYILPKDLNQYCNERVDMQSEENVLLNDLPEGGHNTVNDFFYEGE